VAIPDRVEVVEYVRRAEEISLFNGRNEFQGSKLLWLSPGALLAGIATVGIRTSIMLSFSFFRRLSTMHTPHHHPVSSLLWTLFCIGPLLLPLRFIRPCISLFCSVSSTGFLYLPLLFYLFLFTLLLPSVFSLFASIHPLRCSALLYIPMATPFLASQHARPFCSNHPIATPFFISALF
jgi:hypothetical protein